MPTRLNCRVARRVGVGDGRCEQNSRLAHDDCRRIRSTIWKWPNRLHSGLTTWILIDIHNLFNNDVIMSSLDTNLNSSTAQKIVKCVTIADGCVHTAHVPKLDSWVASASAVCIEFIEFNEVNKKIVSYFTRASSDALPSNRMTMT